MRRGFTLIELLVVIAIIAILAAILFPVFAQAKVAAKGAANLSNQKQVMLAALMYANDNDDTHALAFRISAGAPPFVIETVYDGILPYTKNADLFASPLDPTATNWPLYIATLDAALGGGLARAGDNYTYLGFSANGGIFGTHCHPVLQPANWQVTTSSEVPFPAGQPVFYDGYSAGGDSIYQVIDPRNAESTTVAYLDGHVGKVRAYRNPNPDPRRFDPFVQEQMDEWLNASGPFKNFWRMTSIVEDPTCGPDKPDYRQCIRSKSRIPCTF